VLEELDFNRELRGVSGAVLFPLQLRMWETIIVGFVFFLNLSKLHYSESFLAQS